MTKAQIIALQERIGTKPDGLWGDVSTAACQRHLSDWHVIVSVGSYSLAKRDLSALKKYKHLDIEIRETTSIQDHA